MLNTEPTTRGWLGNPHKIKSAGGDVTRTESIELFKRDFYQKLNDNPEFKAAVLELKGAVLGCYCKPKACHGDVIVDYIRSQQTQVTDF